MNSMSIQIHSPTFCHNSEEKLLKCKEFSTQILASRSQYKKEENNLVT